MDRADWPTVPVSKEELCSTLLNCGQPFLITQPGKGQSDPHLGDLASIKKRVNSVRLLVNLCKNPSHLNFRWADIFSICNNNITFHA